jgi:hypothetical protein
MPAPRRGRARRPRRRGVQKPIPVGPQTLDLTGLPGEGGFTRGDRTLGPPAESASLPEESTSRHGTLAEILHARPARFVRAATDVSSDS